MKALLLIICFCGVSYAQTVVYDKFSDKTYYKSKEVEVYRNKGGLLLDNPARVVIQALRVSGDDAEYALLFQVDSYNWQFTRDCTVRVLADGKRYELPCSREDSHAYTLVNSVYVTEGLVLKISAEDFKSCYLAPDFPSPFAVLREAVGKHAARKSGREH